MICRDARGYLGPYLDSELDRDLTWRIAQHLGGCEACRALFDREWRIESSLRDSLREPAGDETVIFDRAFERAIGPGRRPWIGWAAAALLLLAAALAWRLASPAATPELVRMAAADHLEYRELVAESIEGAHGDQALEWLSGELDVGKLELPPHASWTVEWARVCRFGGQRVGYVMMHSAGRPVSVFVVPPDGDFPDARRAAAEGRSYRLDGGLEAVLVSDRELVVAAVGELRAEELSVLARAVRSEGPRPGRE